MTKIQLIGFIGMIAFCMLGFYFIINIFNKKKDERENIVLLKAIKSAIIATFFALWLLIIFYTVYGSFTVPSGLILLVLASSILIIILSYKINLSEKTFSIKFLEGKSKEWKRKILTHLSNAFGFISVVFVFLILSDEIKSPQSNGANPYFLGFFICLFLQVYISTKIPKKKQSNEEILKISKRKKLIIIMSSILLFVSIGFGVTAFFIKH